MQLLLSHSPSSTIEIHLQNIISMYPACKKYLLEYECLNNFYEWWKISNRNRFDSLCRHCRRIAICFQMNCVIWLFFQSLCDNRYPIKIMFQRIIWIYFSFIFHEGIIKAHRINDQQHNFAFRIDLERGYLWDILKRFLNDEETLLIQENTPNRDEKWCQHMKEGNRSIILHLFSAADFKSFLINLSYQGGGEISSVKFGN